MLFGMILIGVWWCGGDVLVEVWDSGFGIVVEYCEWIFDEFEWFESKGSVGGGVGLGLVIVCWIVVLLGLSVELCMVLGWGLIFVVWVLFVVVDWVVLILFLVKVYVLLLGLCILCVDNDVMIFVVFDVVLWVWCCVLLLVVMIVEVM